MKLTKSFLVTALGLFLAVSNANAGKKDIVDTAVSAGKFKTLAAALQAGGLVDALKGDGPFTVFAPTDAAFKKLPKGTVETLLKPENKKQLVDILTYHVVAGNVPAEVAVTLTEAKALNKKSIKVNKTTDGLFLNKSKVVMTDIECSNGVIHVIDAVLLPPAKPQAKDIVDTAVSAGQFKTLAAALQAGGLIDALKGDGPFTVFAPTDKAFAKLPKGTVETLLKPENKAQLVDILTYHVVKGKVPSTVAVTLDKATALNKKVIGLKKTDKGLFLNKSKVIKTDIECSNGVIHVIDAVLLPPAEKKGSKTSSGSAKDLVMRAIERGVPLFNHGQHEACAAIYEITAHALVSMPESEVPSHMKRSMKMAIAQANRSHNSMQNAWTYRNAFDQMMASAN